MESVQKTIHEMENKLFSAIFTTEDIVENESEGMSEVGKKYLHGHNTKAVKIEWAIKNRDFESLVKLVTITNHAAGSKMANKISISTSVTINPICIARRALNPAKYVCPHCFANAISNARPTARRSCKRNSYILTSIVIPVEYWRNLKLTRKQRENAKNGIRLESLGDVCNVIQCANYINVVKAFPEYSFTVWSKNWKIWELAFAIYGKPENLIYIHSSSMLNKIDNPASDFAASYMDYDFTVYEREYAITNPQIEYNCCTPYESRQCVRDCNECYSKHNYIHRGEILR